MEFFFEFCKLLVCEVGSAGIVEATCNTGHRSTGKTVHWTVRRGGVRRRVPTSAAAIFSNIWICLCCDWLGHVSLHLHPLVRRYVRLLLLLLRLRMVLLLLLMMMLKVLGMLARRRLLQRDLIARRIRLTLLLVVPPHVIIVLTYLRVIVQRILGRRLYLVDVIGRGASGHRKLLILGLVVMVMVMTRG